MVKPLIFKGEFPLVLTIKNILMKTKKTFWLARFFTMCFGFTIISAIGYAQFNVPENYSTIQEAINAASNAGGGKVYVDDGTYYENLTIYDKVFVISTNENPESAIINAGDSGDIVVFDACLNGGIIGFTLQNGGSNGQFAGVKIAGDQAPIVAKNIIMNTKNGIKIQGDAQPLIINNTIVNNIDNGLLAGGNSPATILNNIIAYNLVAGISMNGGAIDLLEYNCVFGNTADYDNISAGENDISEDPLFASADDFHLQEASPCKNTGYTFGEQTTDMGAYGGDIDIDNDYTSEMYSIDGNVTTNLGVSILVAGTKKAIAKTKVTKADRATYGLSKKKISGSPSVISYIIFSEITGGNITLDFSSSGLEASSIEVYKVNIENASFSLKSSSPSFSVSSTDLNGVWMVKGQQATNIELPESSQVNIFPNPSQGVFSINLNEENYGAQIEIKDITGRSVYDKTANKTKEEINLNQQKGLFVVKITNGTEVVTKKILVF